MTLFTLALIAVVILAVIGLGWQTFAIAVLDGFDKTLDVGIPLIKNLTQEAQATAGNPKTPEREIMAQTVDPNPSLIQLASGGICAIDDNMKAMEEELDADFTPAMEEELRLQAIDALNETVAFVNSDNEPGEELIILGNPEDC